MTNDLRKQLDTLPKEDINDQSDRLEVIRKEHKHTVTALNTKHLFCDWGTYNCYEYALGLTASNLYVDVKKQNVHANSMFIAYLLSNTILKEQECNDCVILYFNKEDHPRHAGLYKNKKVKSKWGTGLVFEHEIFEVPLRYGDSYKCYSHIKEDDMLEHFYDYAETQGIKFQYD